MNKPMAEYNWQIEERGKKRRMNVLIALIAPPVVYFISTVDYWVDAGFKAIGM